MTGNVEWPVLLTIVSCIILTVGITGGVIVRVFTWVYADSNQRRAEADNLRAEISKLRTDVSQTYVTLEAQRIIKEAIDERGDHLEAAVHGLAAAVDRLSEKQDRSIGELVKALTARFAQA
jgi:outer membrane murein-binding lipoprotein Lpp